MVDLVISTTPRAQEFMGSLGGYLVWNMMFLVKKPRGLLPRLARWFRCGYGSIPINTMFSEMNIHLPAILMFTRGTRFWPIPMWWFRCLITAAVFFNIFDHCGCLELIKTVAKTWIFLWQWVKPCQTPAADDLWTFFVAWYNRNRISKHLETSQNCWAKGYYSRCLFLLNVLLGLTRSTVYMEFLFG